MERLGKQIQAISLVPFNTVTKPILSVQASSASAKCIFGDLSGLEDGQWQSLMSTTLEIMAKIRTNAYNELELNVILQTGTFRL